LALLCQKDNTVDEALQRLRDFEAGRYDRGKRIDIQFFSERKRGLPS
jgi:hypothetical protein